MLGKGWMMGGRCTDQEWTEDEEDLCRWHLDEQAESFYFSYVAVSLIDQERELMNFYQLCGLSYEVQLGPSYTVLSKDV